MDQVVIRAQGEASVPSLLLLAWAVRLSVGYQLPLRLIASLPLDNHTSAGRTSACHYYLTLGKHKRLVGVYYDAV
eukprot:1193598-Prorocentrum_minimum.AAC.1